MLKQLQTLSVFATGREPFEIEKDDEKSKVCVELVTKTLTKTEEHSRKNLNIRLARYRC